MLLATVYTATVLPVLGAVGAQAPVGTGLNWLDIVIILIPLLIASGVALYMRQFNRSIADFLAANRTAGRYLICTAQMDMGITAMGLVASLEVFSRTGYSLSLWSNFTGFSFFVLALSGIVTFRFRETRALTFHQFFEMRYSKGVRVFATILNVFSGLFTFGIMPGVAARFFVYLLGFPIALHVGSFTIPTTIVVMIVLMSLALFFAFSGGHLSVMMVDCVEGVISSVLFLVVSFAVLSIFSTTQMREALCSGAAGSSFVDPLDVSKQTDFGYTYVIIGWLMSIYFWRGNAWNAAFAASSKTAHEGQMATIVGVWRGAGYGAMGAIIGLGAFVLMHHPRYAGQADSVRQYLNATIPEADKQLRTQVLLPTAMGTLLPIGVKGALCAIFLMGTIAGLSSSLFNFGTGFIQDVYLPLRGRHMEPKHHIRLLRYTAFGLALFSVWFSTVFKITDYLQLFMNLLSGIYLAGIGCVVWGGLYWKRATNQAAWVSLLVGSSLAITGSLLQQVWTKWECATRLAAFFGPGKIHDSLLADVTKMPINSQILTAIIMGLCLVLFIVISLLTCKEPHNMDKLLHRGQWAVADEHKAVKRKFSLSFLAGVNSDNFTRGDKRLAYAVFFMGMVNPVVAVLALGWNVAIARWSANGWFNYHFTFGVVVPLTMGILTFFWYTWGASHDMVQLVRDLKKVKIDVSDDGLVTKEKPAVAADGQAEKQEEVATK